MNDNHWYPRDPQRWLTDTTWCDAATEVAHNRLTDTYYALGKPLVDSQPEIMAMGKITLADYVRVRGCLQRLGWRFENGELRHKRIEETLAKMEANRRLQMNRTSAATAARLDKRNEARHVARDVMVKANVTKPVTLIVTKSKPEPEPEPEPQGNDKASGPTKPSKLLPLVREAAEAAEGALEGQWVNDAGKWITRAKLQPRRVLRVMAEVANAAKEKRITSTPAQYAEETWKWFK